MRFFGRCRGWVCCTPLLKRPVEEVENLALPVSDAGFGETLLAVHRPHHPRFLDTLVTGTCIERTIAIHRSLIAVALHQKRPKVAVLVIARSLVAARVPKKWPQVILVYESWSCFAGIKWKKANFATRSRIRCAFGWRMNGVVPTQRPQIKSSIIGSRFFAPAKHGPKSETLFSASS